ncbi:Protein of unknown function [Halopseudomonas xinjiangensis]|uniref:DUF1440 domain-containing protein n=1 Tax=Halopseudomonas xinjiangensis TaxID=487184 RepID=A0A1H1UZ62_9GAMM|nr:DUF1440 domain-containing protein [Halopseudomonas xinjiangensis]SDS77396.1 Protein of unknown function [Halopseudomonas xinjiangensis]
MLSKSSPGNTLLWVAAGAAAGTLAVWVMDRLDWYAYKRMPERDRQRTIDARPQGMDPAHVMADKVAGLAGKHVEQPHPAGMAIHYSLGMLPGALYGALYDKVPLLGAGRGSLFGLGLFLAQDEGLNTLMGLSGKPGEYPWQDHARGLAAHVLFGVVTDTAIRFLRNRL